MHLFVSSVRVEIYMRTNMETSTCKVESTCAGSFIDASYYQNAVYICQRHMQISAMQSSGQSSFGVPIECVWTVLVLFDIPFALLRWPAQPFLVALSGAH